MACGILVPQPRIKPMPPAMETQCFNHWAIMEVTSSFITLMKSVSTAFSKPFTPPLSSPKSEYLLLLPHVTLPLIHYPILFILAIKYAPNKSPLLHFHFCYNPTLSLFLTWISLLTCFPTFTVNSHQYLLHTTSKNLCTMHHMISWSFSMTLQWSYLGKKELNIQHPEPLKLTSSVPTPLWPLFVLIITQIFQSNTFSSLRFFLLTIHNSLIICHFSAQEIFTQWSFQTPAAHTAKFLFTNHWFHW